MKYLKKRGSHVGIMISFSLFILFLLSLFLLLNPVIKEKEEKKPLLDLVSEKILENVSSNMTLTLLKISDTYPLPVGKNCVNISEDWLSGEDAAVRDILNQRIASNSGTPLSINWTGDKFLKIYSSPENFEDMPLETSDCATPIEDSEFFISAVKTEKYAFNSSIARLKTFYDSSYEELKTSLSIPLEEEFGFDLINSEGVIEISAGEAPSSRSIYSKDIPTIYVNNNGDFVPGIIRIRAW